MALSRESIRQDYPWLNKELLEKIVREKYNDSNVGIEEYDIIPALAPGENYASIVVRANMTLKNCEAKTLNAILKLSHIRADIVEMMQEFNLFEKETYFYTGILNRCHEVLRAAGINTKLSADLISECSSPSYVMFEDLKQYGYGLMNKFRGLHREIWCN